MIDEILRYEAGELHDEEINAMFQKMIDSGLVWLLQGHYGRTARRLIANCACTEAATKETKQ
jgi:hypothetical protein